MNVPNTLASNHNYLVLHSAALECHFPLCIFTYFSEAMILLFLNQEIKSKL